MRVYYGLDFFPLASWAKLKSAAQLSTVSKYGRYGTCLVMRMLAAFMSLWMILLLWMKKRPSNICCITFLISPAHIRTGAHDQTLAFRTPAKLRIRLGQWIRFKIRIQASINGHSTKNNNKIWCFNEIVKRISVRSLFNPDQTTPPKTDILFSAGHIFGTYRVAKKLTRAAKGGPDLCLWSPGKKKSWELPDTKKVCRGRKNCTLFKTQVAASTYQECSILGYL